jgi:hypothetical protein
MPPHRCFLALRRAKAFAVGIEGIAPPRESYEYAAAAVVQGLEGVRERGRHRWRREVPPSGGRERGMEAWADARWCRREGDGLREGCREGVKLGIEARVSCLYMGIQRLLFI